jgi:hypothetical protein
VATQSIDYEYAIGVRGSGELTPHMQYTAAAEIPRKGKALRARNSLNSALPTPWLGLKGIVPESDRSGTGK